MAAIVNKACWTFLENVHGMSSEHGHNINFGFDEIWVEKKSKNK